jgi:hypothetical protein
MEPATKTIPIRSAAAHPGCGACAPSPSGPICRMAADQHSGPPQLSGPPGELARLMAALAPQLGFDPGTDPLGLGLVRSLQVQPGEVTLQLAVGRQCGGMALAETAFETLRGLLPDTDIYVTHAA